MRAAPQISIPVGVVVERHKATSPWIDFVWRPGGLGWRPRRRAWSFAWSEGDVTTYYAGAATVELHRSDGGNYRGNLATVPPKSGSAEFAALNHPTSCCRDGRSG